MKVVAPPTEGDLSQLELFSQAMTSQIESSSTLEHTPLYENEHKERKTI